MKVPIYSKQNVLNPVEKETAKYYERVIISKPEFITLHLSPIVASPPNSPGMSTKPYRSSYLANRGIPPWSKVLFIIDTCHSSYMTHFPFMYLSKEQKMIPTPVQNSFVQHVDMPYCVSISSCEVDKITKSPHEGSQLTQVLFSQLMNVSDPLNFMQFYYYIINTDNSIFKNYIVRNTLTPVLSSTSNNSELHVPFFSNSTIVKPRKIVK